jgi:hypothetical protein
VQRRVDVVNKAVARGDGVFAGLGDGRPEVELLRDRVEAVVVSGWGN